MSMALRCVQQGEGTGKCKVGDIADARGDIRRPRSFEWNGPMPRAVDSFGALRLFGGHGRQRRHFTVNPTLSCALYTPILTAYPERLREPLQPDGRDLPERRPPIPGDFPARVLPSVRLVAHPRGGNGRPHGLESEAESQAVPLRNGWAR